MTTRTLPDAIENALRNFGRQTYAAGARSQDPDRDAAERLFKAASEAGRELAAAILDALPAPGDESGGCPCECHQHEVDQGLYTCGPCCGENPR